MQPHHDHWIWWFLEVQSPKLPHECNTTLVTNFLTSLRYWQFPGLKHNGPKLKNDTLEGSKMVFGKIEIKKIEQNPYGIEDKYGPKSNRPELEPCWCYA